jgi:hypothetical protein
LKPRHLEIWFGLNSHQPPRASSYRAQLRFDGRAELHDARFAFEGGWAKPGRMVHALVWFRAPAEALTEARPTVRFDVLELGQVVATGEVLAR